MYKTLAFVMAVTLLEVQVQCRAADQPGRRKASEGAPMKQQSTETEQQIKARLEKALSNKELVRIRLKCLPNSTITALKGNNSVGGTVERIGETSFILKRQPVIFGDSDPLPIAYAEVNGVEHRSWFFHRAGQVLAYAGAIAGGVVLMVIVVPVCIAGSIIGHPCPDC
jgi:hypothetical protein